MRCNQQLGAYEFSCYTSDCHRFSSPDVILPRRLQRNNVVLFIPMQTANRHRHRNEDFERPPILRLVALLIMMAASAPSAYSQDLHCKGSSVDADYRKWECTVTGLESRADVTLRIEIPKSVLVAPAPSAQFTLRREILGTGNLRQIKFLPPPDENVFKDNSAKFTLTAAKREVSAGIIDWTIEGKEINTRGRTPGPAVVYDPSIIRPVFAVNNTWRRDDEIDFKVENNILLIENDSSLRPSAVAGILVNILEFQGIGPKKLNERKTLDFLLSLEFSTASSESIDGFVFGLGLGLNRYLEIVGGVSVRTGLEISPGFMRAARQLAQDVANLPDLEEYAELKSKFKRFENVNTEQNLDGFPTISPINNKSIFPGNPLINSTNTALILGVALPVDIFNLIRGQ